LRRVDLFSPPSAAAAAAAVTDAAGVYLPIPVGVRSKGMAEAIENRQETQLT